MIKTKCGSCGKLVKGGDDWAGRTASCPNCRTPITFPSQSDPLSVESPPKAAAKPIAPSPRLAAESFQDRSIFSPPPTAAPEFASVDRKAIEQQSQATAARRLPPWAQWAIPVAALVVGFFAGREQMKYQIASAFADFGNAFRQGLLTPPDESAASTTPTRPAEDPEVSKQQEAEKKLHAAEIAKIVVLKSSLSKDSDSFSFRPTIELQVRNGSDRAIKQLKMHGVYATAGRALPWAEDDINYEPSGGLEHGETGSWSLSPNIMSKLGHVEIRPGAALHVSIVDIEFAN